MLSLASNISATQAVEAKYSASFGGTDDFIDFGNVNNLGSGDFSFSFWVKASDVTSNYLLSKREDNNNRWYIRTEGNDRVQFYAVKSGVDIMTATSSSSGELSANVWNHVVIACDRSDTSTGLKFYINSQLENSRPASATDIDNTGDFYIGRFSTNYAKDGTFLEEIGIFNVALDANAVTAIYNGGSPLNLKFDQGNYNSSSALQAYYRMGDGLFDDKANGIIHDQDNPGFGSEIVTGNNATFDGANDWIAYNPSGTTGISTTGGVLQVTLSGAGDTIDSGAKLEVTSSLTAGKVYKVKADIWLGTETETSGWRIYLGGVDNAITLSSSQTTFVKYITITDTSDLLIYNTDVDSSTGTFFIDNVSVKELNGNPGVTSGGVTFSSDTP